MHHRRGAIEHARIRRNTPRPLLAQHPGEVTSTPPFVDAPSPNFTSSGPTAPLASQQERGTTDFFRNSPNRAGHIATSQLFASPSRHTLVA